MKTSDFTDKRKKGKVTITTIKEVVKTFKKPIPLIVKKKNQGELHGNN